MSRPTMVPVDSAAIVAVGYDAARSELYVEYRDGDTYVYALVPARVHRALLAAPSKGAYVNTEVKPRYGYRPA